MIAARDLLMLCLLALLALLLTLLPLPDKIAALRPAWVLLVLSAWVLQRNHRFVLLVAFFSGLLLDAVSGVALGMHGMALIVSLAVTLRLRPILRAMPLWQSSACMLPIFALQALTTTVLDGLTQEAAETAMHWLAIPLSVALWPLAALLLQPRPVAPDAT